MRPTHSGGRASRAWAPGVLLRDDAGSFKKGKSDAMPFSCSSASPVMNLQRLEEILYDLPPLEGVFLHWHTHGATSTTPGMLSLLSRRRQLLGPATLSAASVQLLAACAIDCLRRFQAQEACSSWDNRPLHARLVRHGPSLRAVETQTLLPPRVLVQKTVSVALVNAIIIEDHPLPGKVSHFPKQSAMLERNVEQSGGKERCIQCHFEMKFAPGC